MNHYNRYVPDEGPEDARILLVGEAPGADEHLGGRPFIGPSGDLLMGVLSRNGIQRGEVRLANLCHYRPNDNKFELLLGSDVLRDGLAELKHYILTHRPYVIGALGKYPLELLTGKQGIDHWRGSILPCIFDETIKVIPTRHPAAVYRERSLYPIFDKDIKRIIHDSADRNFNLPKRQYVCDPKGLDAEEWTQTLCKANTLATDIETVKKSTKILCVGFAPSKDVGVCFPLNDVNRTYIQRILASDAKKVFQFGTFDTTQLKLNDFQIIDPMAARLGRVYYWDTLVAGHVYAPELPRSLEFFTSIYTREPYYKTEGRGTIPDDEKGWRETFDRDALYTYNAKDCACTFEVHTAQREEMMDDSVLMNTFDFEMSFLEVLHHMNDNGMPIDAERREFLEAAIFSKWAKKQVVLNTLVGEDVNVRSTALKRILYSKESLGLPTRKKRDGTITTDEDAIVSLISFCKGKEEEMKSEGGKFIWYKKRSICSLILEIRGLRQVLSMYILGGKLGMDGRLHSTYKWGPETGRLACSKYVDGTGLNAQTLPRDPLDVPEDFVASDIIKLLRPQLKDEIEEMIKEAA